MARKRIKQGKKGILSNVSGSFGGVVFAFNGVLRSVRWWKYKRPK